MTYAGMTVTAAQIRGTIKLLAYYKRFLASDCTRCKDPEDDPRWARTMTKDQARRRLSFLINVAINRKAGIPDVACKKQDPDYQNDLIRDCHEVRDHFARHRRPWGLNGRRWHTDYIQRRYGHLLREDDE